MDSIHSLPLWKKIIFAMGQLGWSLASFGVGNLLVYFYMPPETATGLVFPGYIFSGVVFGILTVIGIISAFARLFDAVSNPLIATLSDRSRSRFGKRRLFMLIAVLPFAVFAVLVFLPLNVPVANTPTLVESLPNIVWLSICIVLFYLFFVMYTTPYTALLSELGHTPKERLFMATLISIAWAVGFALGNFVYQFQSIFEKSFAMNATQAFQTVMGLFSMVAFICMLLPIMFIDEKRYARTSVSNEKIFQALRSTLANRNFSRFITAEFFYFVCLTIIQTGMVFFITTLLALNKEDVSFFMTIMFLCSFLWYPFINMTAQRKGKKAIIIVGFIVFSVVFIACALMGILPIDARAHAIIVVILAAIPLAIFGILPNAVVADIAEADGKINGNYKAGIFFGIRTFEMNLGISIANMLFPSFLLLGKTMQNPLGVRIAAVAATIFCVIGMIIFTRYNEKEVIAAL